MGSKNKRSRWLRMQKKIALDNSRYASANASPGYLFWKTFYAWQRQMRLELDSLGITQVQYAILASLRFLSAENDTVSQQNIADHLAMDKMMVSDVVKTLESKSLIVRQKGLVDKRAFSLRATADALKLLKNATPLVEGVDEAFFGVLTATERKDLISSMLKLNRIED